MNVLTHISKASPKVSQFLGRGKFKLQKNAPHIMFGVGLVGSVASTVMACKATLKLPGTLEDIQADMEFLGELKHDGIEAHYPPGEVDKDRAYVYIKSVGKLGRLYGPSVAVGLVSIGLLSGAHVQLTRRNASLLAAYAVLQKSYMDYREKVAAELGEDRERELYGALQKMKEDEAHTVSVVDDEHYSPYARFFDEISPNFIKDCELNRVFLQNQQNWANDRLNAVGHVFLNEVYDMLGLERSQAGQVVGWVLDGSGDEYIDFGFDKVSDFINGIEPRVLLDFNVDGVIYNKI